MQSPSDKNRRATERGSDAPTLLIYKGELLSAFAIS
jgi:hypothetical protein